MTLLLFITALFLTFFSGVPGLFLPAGTRVSQRVATLLHLTGCAAGIASAVMVFAGSPVNVLLAWPLPGGFVGIRIDGLSAFFLFPLFLVMGAGTLYGEGYWSEKEHSDSGRKLRIFYGALTGGLALVTVGADAWSFLFGWEIVGLAAFFLVITERDKREALEAGWIYLIATHVATLLLFAMFALYRTATGTWMLEAGGAVAVEAATPILVLALLAFGIKAGLMPFHVWLPEAHSAAPSHISAVLSGVVLKMGVYGLIRMMTLLPLERWFGLTLLFAGITSGILGVVFALAQHDLKRLLAYHSIENIGIIFIGLGAAVLGGREGWAMLAFAGALLHVWNHSFFKALLFFAAGSVIHATGLRAIDRLGGLLPHMRVTGICFLIGAVAISGLPPLNGFVSEWLIYMAAFRAAVARGEMTANAAMLAAPVLALIGALAVACFVKVFSVVFLGQPRSARMELAHEAPFSMRAAMVFLAAVCVVIGIAPFCVAGVLSSSSSIMPGSGGTALAGLLMRLSLPAILIVAVSLVVGTVIALRARRSGKSLTWDCGYARPTARMQYTASSFAAPITGMFRWALRTEAHHGKQSRLFPETEVFETHVPDPVLERILAPGFSRFSRLMSYGRFLQAGRIQVYIFYIIATLVILMAWGAVW